MTCGLLAKIAVTAVLLGQQQLKIENFDQSSVVKFCTTNEPSTANATMVLRDAKGKSVFESRIRVGAFDFYNNGSQRGAAPAKATSFLYSYPVTKKTSKAVTIELKMDDGPFKQATNLQNNILRSIASESGGQVSGQL